MNSFTQLKEEIISMIKIYLPNGDKDIYVPVTIKDRKGIATLITRKKDNLMVTIKFGDDIEVGNLNYLTFEEVAKIADQL